MASRLRLSGNQVVYGIMGINTAVFGAWKISEAQYDRKALRFLNRHFVLQTNDLRHGRYHTLLTSIFSHFSLSHFLVNQFGLYTFGLECSSLLGVSRFLFVYLGGGLFGSLCFAAYPLLKTSTYYYPVNHAGLGASGAICSMLAYFVCTYPLRPIYFFGLLPIPSALFGVGYFGYEYITAQESSANIAHLAGGAVGALYWVYRHFRGRGNFIRRIR